MKHKTLALTAVISAVIFSSSSVMADNYDQYDDGYFIEDVDFHKGDGVSVNSTLARVDLAVMEMGMVRDAGADSALEVVEEHLNTEK